MQLLCLLRGQTPTRPDHIPRSPHTDESKDSPKQIYGLAPALLYFSPWLFESLPCSWPCGRFATCCTSFSMPSDKFFGASRNKTLSRSNWHTFGIPCFC